MNVLQKIINKQKGKWQLSENGTFAPSQICRELWLLFITARLSETLRTHRARLGFGKQVEHCQGPQIMKCILTRVRVDCLSRSLTLWTKKSVMIIQTLPPVTGSILLPELLSIRMTSGAPSITVRKELKESARVWHILWGVIVTPRGIFGRSHYRVLIQTSCFSVGNNKVFGQHATNQHDLGWWLLLVDIVPLLVSWEWLPKPSPGNTMHSWNLAFCLKHTHTIFLFTFL